MNKILAINGSYRDDGITDQAVNLLVQALRDNGAEVEVVLLREYHIEFCLNCRECTQQPGDSPGICVQHDGMQALVNKIEQADAYIFAAPTNFGSVTALFKRFMERLVVYGYWPWGAHAPVFRKAKLPKKKAILVSSCAAPGFIGRWIYGTHKQLNVTAQTVGAKAVATLFTGLVSGEPHARLPERVQARLKKLAEKIS
jgi:multimeric flavodoxin WrbA